MGESISIILIVGLVAQICFGLRQLLQWWASEKAHAIQSPLSFWLLSLLGALFFLIYGVLRLDFAVVLGQFLNFYIYCRNLYFKGIWIRISKSLRIIILLVPVAIMVYLYVYHADTFQSVFMNQEIEFGWFLIGTIGYLLFTLRFVYQWYVSERSGTSELPIGFFVLSIIGSVLIIAYGIYRSDIILIFPYLGGLVIYARNIAINYRNTHKAS